MEENNEKKRMLKIVDSFSKKNEILKESRELTNSEKLTEEYKRLSDLASGRNTGAIRESDQGAFMGGNSPMDGGAGQRGSVNSIGTFNQYPGATGNLVALKDGEAIDISIKRTLESGAPVNNISFYDEVNWNLAQLGFPSKLPQDIKNNLLKLISK